GPTLQRRETARLCISRESRSGARVLKSCALATQILQSVRLQLVLQAANADPKEPGGLGPVAAGQVKSPDDVAALHLAERQPRLEPPGQVRSGGGAGGGGRPNAREARHGAADAP